MLLQLPAVLVVLGPPLGGPKSACMHQPSVPSAPKSAWRSSHTPPAKMWRHACPGGSELHPLNWWPPVAVGVSRMIPGLAKSAQLNQSSVVHAKPPEAGHTIFWRLSETVDSTMPLP